MAYNITYKKSVLKDLKRIDKKQLRRIIGNIEKKLKSKPGTGKALAGEFKGLFRLRVGAYRVIYSILEKEVLKYIPDEGFSDFAYDIFPKLLSSSVPIYGYYLTSADYFIDIGTLEKYHQANADSDAGKMRI